MAVVRLQDIIEPQDFTNYILQETMEKTALVRSGVMTRNSVMQDKLRSASETYNVPFWRDLANTEADIVSDDPDEYSIPRSIGTGKQTVRKSYLHASWSAMNLASEIAGDNAISRIQSRVRDYWDRQMQRRLIAALNGVMAANVANNDGDMVHDITAKTGAAANFSAEAVIDAAGLLGDSMGNVTGIAMHSTVYQLALKNDLIEFVQDSRGSMSMPTFRGLAVTVDDGLEADETGNYTSILFGGSAVGYGMAAPNIADGTEIESKPSAGNGGGQQILHSRVNVTVHPAGFNWIEGTSIAGESPTIAELSDPAHWERIIERKSVPLSFLVSKVA